MAEGKEPTVTEVDLRPNTEKVMKKKTELERYINLLGIANFGFTLQAGWEAIGMSVSIVFLNGGSVALVWGALLAGIGHVLVALSLAEMASMDPTIGAQYRWSARYANKNPEFWGFVQGWLTTFAWVVTAAAPLSYLATTTQALIEFHHPLYVPQAWQATLIMWAYLLLTIICNMYFRRILNWLETVGGVCHFVFFLVCVIILLTMAERSSASYVFSNLISDQSGWNSPGVSFHIGLLVVLLPLSGYDSVLHMINETKKARERVPKTMVWAVVSNSVLVFAYAIVLMFCVGDEEAVTGALQPLLPIYYAATNSKAVTTVVLVMHMFIILLSIINVVASASRLVWAFARDKGLPGSDFLVRVNPQLQIPLQAFGVVVVVTVILSLINLASSVAVAAILAIPTVALFVSYFIPIFLLVIRKLKGQHPRYGPFQLGRWGLPINLFSLCFCAYSAFWCAFPTSAPVTSTNMNYAGPILIGLVVLCVGDWYRSGRKRFSVPVGRDENEMDHLDSSEGSRDTKGY